MELLIKPTKTSYNKAKDMIKVMDSTPKAPITNNILISKLAKNIKTLKIPVARFFDSPAQISSYYAEGEYDLVLIFKMLDYEAYFAKSVQKKVGLLSKSGFSIHCNNDEIKTYINSRFKVMELQTGKSIQSIIKQLARYLVICSNGFIVKVRDKNFEYASSYTIDGKEQHPVVGYFLAHPTTMKPRFKYVKDQDTGLSKIELDKWVHINRRGILKAFELADVCHFTLNKQDGLVFGTPEIIPALDDIKVLRKIEEDCQLLIYRDLFPIIHYKIEKPVVLDHMGGLDELTQARNDMQNIIQDGGIATDARHEINFVGNGGKGFDVSPLLSYFQQRVFSGLGISPTDVGMISEGNKGSADNASDQVIDYVKDVQQEIANQFKVMILTELMLQSPYSVEEIFDPENEVILKFEEVDIEWKVRTENHEADLFAKGVNTIHETRNKMGKRDISDDDLMYTFHGLYGGGEPPAPAMLETEYGNNYIKKQGELAHAITVPTATSTAKTGTLTKTVHAKPKQPIKSTESAASIDPIKGSKTNSNIVKHKDEMIEDSISIQDNFIALCDSLKDVTPTKKKLNLMVGTKLIYDSIKEKMADKVKEGANAAAKDIGIEIDNINIEHNIFAPLDKLRDSVVDMVFKDEKLVKRAALRISTANKTEQSRSYNYGYSLTCLKNNIDTVIVTSDVNDISTDNTKYIGSEIKLDQTSLLEQIPPFHPNSRLKIRAKMKDSVINI